MRQLFVYGLFLIIFCSVINLALAATYQPQLSAPGTSPTSPTVHNATQAYNFNVTLTSYEEPWSVYTVNITSEGPYRGAYVWKDSVGDIDNDGINEIMVAIWDQATQTHAKVYAFWWNATTQVWNNQSIYDYIPASAFSTVGWMWNGDFYGNGTRYVVFAVNNDPDYNSYFHMLSFQDVRGYINTTSDQQVGGVVQSGFWHGFQVFDINNDTFREIISGTCAAPGTDSGKVVEVVVASNTTYERQQLTKHFGAIGIGDLDGDGTMDMVGSSYELGNAISYGGVFTAIYNQTPAGGDWLKINYYMNTSNLGTAGQGGFIVEVGDADNDGQNEAILVPYVSNAAKVKSVWMVNYYKDPVTGYIREAGNVSIMNITNAEATDGAIIIKDLDGDGQLETYVSFTRQGQPAIQYSMNEIHRILMTNNSVISDTVLLNYSIDGQYNPDESAWSLTSGDVDNDGINELVAGTKYWDTGKQKVIMIKRINSSTYADDVLLELGGVNYTATNTTDNFFNYTFYGLTAGTYSYRWWANNTYGNITYLNYSTYIVTDGIYPQFTNVTSAIDGTLSLFNSTITNTNGTSGITFEGVNYTAYNTTADLFQLNISGLTIGTYSYYWWSFGSGGLHHYNITGLYNHTYVASDVGIGICSASYMYPLANFTFRDSVSSEELNASISTFAITYHTTGNSTVQNFSYFNVTAAPYVAICGNQNGHNYTISSIDIYATSTSHWPATYSTTGTWYPNINVSTDIWFGNSTSSFFIQDLINYWHFDETAYTGAADEVIDTMGNNHGTVYGNVTSNESGYYYRGAKFDGSTEGSGSYINITNPTNITDNFTVASWVYPTSNILNSAILDTGFNSSYLFYFGMTGKYKFYVNDSVGTPRGVESTSAAPLNEWSHVAGVWNSTHCLLYFNGVLNNTALCDSPPAAQTYMYIGKFQHANSSNYSINGSIDELMIWNRSLTTAEVQSLYNSSQYHLYKANTSMDPGGVYTMWLAKNASTQTEVFSCVDSQCTNYSQSINSTFNLNPIMYFPPFGGTTALITFQVQNQGGSALSGTIVTAERISDNYLLGTKVADGSGAVSFVMDMLLSYRLNFTKTGYAFLSTTLTPTQPIYTIYLTAETSNTSYTNILEDINYTYGPKSGFLNSSTLYTFWFTVNSTNGNLTNYTMNIELPNGTILNTTTGTNVNGSNLTVLLNTNDYLKLYGKYYIAINNTTYQMGGTTIWSIVNTTAGDNSVWNFINNLRGYTVDPSDHYTTLWFTFFFIFIGFAILSKFTGMELLQPGISLIIVMLIVAVISYVGFLTIDFTPSTFIDKYGILGISLCYSIGYGLGRLRDT